MPLNTPQEFVFRMRHPIQNKRGHPVITPSSASMSPELAAEIRRTIILYRPMTYKRLAELMGCSPIEVKKLEKEAAEKLLDMFLNHKPIAQSSEPAAKLEVV